MKGSRKKQNDRTCTADPYDEVTVFRKDPAESEMQEGIGDGCGQETYRQKYDDRQLRDLLRLTVRRRYRSRTGAVCLRICHTGVPAGMYFRIFLLRRTNHILLIKSVLPRSFRGFCVRFGFS